MKTCYFCKGNLERVCIDQMVQIKGRDILVRGLHVERCAQCGEIFLDPDASRHFGEAIAEAD